MLEYFYSSSSLPIDRCSLCSQRVLYFLLVLLILLQQQHTAAAAVTAVVPFKIYFLLIFIAANRGRRVNKQNNYHNREYENTRKFFLAVRQYEKNKNNSKSGQITQGGREGGVTWITRGLYSLSPITVRGRFLYFLCGLRTRTYQARCGHAHDVHAN